MELFFSLFLFLICFDSVRLSTVSKIDPALALLPWTPNNTSEIEVRVNQGCYAWKFEQSEFIQVEDISIRIDHNGNKCVDSIKVHPFWPYEDKRGIFTITALNLYTSEHLRSEIHVAKIESIKISTSSKKIRLGSLESLYAIGFDRELNTFTSLNGANIVWELDNDNITSEKKKGDQIMVLGSSVGSTNVQVNVIEENISSKVNSIVEIFVEDPFKITPHLRRAPYGSLYNIQLVREDTFSLTSTYIYNESYHSCTINREYKDKARIIDKKKLLIKNFDGKNFQDEFIIITTCIDRRVEGSSSNALTYLSYPKGISFALQEDKSTGVIYNNLTINDFVELYYSEGEYLIDKSKTFKKILHQNEITIVQNKKLFVQIKLFNYEGNYLSVPINSIFQFECLKGCDSIVVSSIGPRLNDYEQKEYSGFFQLLGISTGYSEFSFKLKSIGEMNYIEYGGIHSEIANIESIMKVSIVDELSTSFASLPLILYPGEQLFDIKENIFGGKGPFYFCSKNSSIASIDFQTGILKTNYNTGYVEIIIYDLGINLQYNLSDDLSCQIFEKINGLNIQVIVTYVKKFDFLSSSTNYKIYNNTIYAPVTQKELQLDMKAIGFNNFNLSILRNGFEYLDNDLFITKLDTLDILKLIDPCEIMSQLFENKINIEQKSLIKDNARSCIDYLKNELRIHSFIKITDEYDRGILQIKFSNNQFFIKIRGHGNISINKIIEFGVEFIVESTKYTRVILSNNLLINIFQEISFVPVVEENTLSYFEASGASFNEFHIEKESSLVLNLKGGITGIDDIIKRNFKYDKHGIRLTNKSFREQELQDSLFLDESQRLVKFSESEDNSFSYLLKCNGIENFNYIIFEMSILDYRENVLFTMNSQIKVFCKTIDHLNVFWLGRSQPKGRYTCNTKNENCLVFHFDSSKIHKFIALAYDDANNLLLSYNKYKSNWRVENADIYFMYEKSEGKNSFENNIIDLKIDLEDKHMKDINIIFEAFKYPDPDNLEKEDLESSFKVFTKGIFTKPPNLISPNMIISDYTDVQKYHFDFNNNAEDQFIHDLGHWTLLKGEHQLGIIYGTNNYKIYLEDKTLINYGLCDNYSHRIEYKLETNKSITEQFLENLNIYYFCLNSNTHAKNGNNRSITLYIEDQLILPTYIIKKQLMFGKLDLIQLIWFDRFTYQEYSSFQSRESLNFNYYIYKENSEENETKLDIIKIPYHYIWFLKLKNDLYYYNLNITNTLPCLNKFVCIINNKIKTFLTTILVDEEENVFEPWQSNLKIEIEYKIKNFTEENISEIFSGNSNQKSNIDIKSLMSSVLFQIEEPDNYNIEIEIKASMFDNIDKYIYSNSIILNVYESIEVDPDFKKITLFPYGSPLRISFTGGPVNFYYRDFEFQWHIYSEKNRSEDSTDNVLLIRDNTQLIIEPLGSLGHVKLYIEYFLIRKSAEITVFKSQIYSNFIDVYVDIPNNIEIYSPDSQYLYLGYPKIYRLKVLNTEKKYLPPYFHSSQLVSSLLTSCNIKWSVDELIDNDLQISDDKHNFVVLEDKKNICIRLLDNTIYYDYHQNFADSTNECKNYLPTASEYSISVYPLGIGISQLSVELNCNFGRKNKILNLKQSQRIRIIKPINFINNGIWLVKNSLYYFNISENIYVEENNNINLVQLNNSQLIYFYTKNISDFFFKIKENRFASQMENTTTFATIITAEPEIVKISLDTYKDNALLISFSLMNSMGIRLYPTMDYCRKFRITLSFLQNDLQDIRTKIIRIATNKSSLINDSTLQENNIIEYCQFISEFNSNQSLALKVMENLSSRHLLDVTGHLSFYSMNSSCLIIQISLYNRILGSQLFCYKSNDFIKTNNYVENFGEVNSTEMRTIDGSNLTTYKYTIDARAGSKIHLNPLKWKILNFIPEKLSFCITTNLKMPNNVESLIIDDISNITNIPKSAINVQDMNLDIRLLSELDISTNDSFYCIDVNRRVDPFKLWFILMNNSSIILNSRNILWLKNNEVELLNDDYNSNMQKYIWKLYSQLDSIKILENETLIIPIEINSPISVILKLSDLIELKINVIPIETSNSFLNSKLLKTSDKKLFLNTPYSFSIYSNGNYSQLVNPLYNNIYYSSPIKYINCSLKDPFLKQIYNLESYWLVEDNVNPHLIPFCKMNPLNKNLTDVAIKSIATETSYIGSIHIIAKTIDEYFDIIITSNASEFSKHAISSVIPIQFHPILLKQFSSIQFSDKSTILNQYWRSDSYNIEIVIPYNTGISSFYKLPLNIYFWFGYLDTQLIAYSIRSPHSDKYLVNFLPNKFQGVIQITRNVSLGSQASILHSIPNLPLKISLEFLSNGGKHQIQILFLDRKNQNKGSNYFEQISFRKNFKKTMYQYSFLIIISITTLLISITHLFLNKSRNYKNSNYSPFRKINTQKW